MLLSISPDATMLSPLSMRRLRWLQARPEWPCFAVSMLMLRRHAIFAFFFCFRHVAFLLPLIMPAMPSALLRFHFDAATLRHAAAIFRAATVWFSFSIEAQRHTSATFGFHIVLLPLRFIFRHALFYCYDYFRLRLSPMPMLMFAADDGYAVDFDDWFAAMPLSMISFFFFFFFLFFAILFFFEMFIFFSLFIFVFSLHVCFYFSFFAWLLLILLMMIMLSPCFSPLIFLIFRCHDAAYATRYMPCFSPLRALFARFHYYACLRHTPTDFILLFFFSPLRFDYFAIFTPFIIAAIFSICLTLRAFSISPPFRHMLILLFFDVVVTPSLSACYHAAAMRHARSARHDIACLRACFYMPLLFADDIYCCRCCRHWYFFYAFERLCCCRDTLSDDAISLQPWDAASPAFSRLLIIFRRCVRLIISSLFLRVFFATPFIDISFFRHVSFRAMLLWCYLHCHFLRRRCRCCRYFHFRLMPAAAFLY